MESSAARQRGEREAPEDTKSVGLHRAQELLELLAAVVLHRRPLRAVVPDAAALDRLGDRRVRVDRFAQGAEADTWLDLVFSSTYSSATLGFLDVQLSGV